MLNLLNLSYEELEAFVLSIGEAKFRAKQIFAPMHKGISPAELTNLSAKTKEKIFESAKYSLPRVRRKLVRRSTERSNIFLSLTTVTALRVW